MLRWSGLGQLMLASWASVGGLAALGCAQASAPASAPAPAYGGRATIHLESLPRGLNYALEGSGILRRILLEVHETLLIEDPHTLELKPNLCTQFRVEASALDKQGGRHHGTEAELRERLGDKLERLIPGTAFVFELRRDVRWHDGAPFDARDVLFSASIYQNPKIDCGERRTQYQKLVEVRALGSHTLVAFYAEPYFRALNSFGDLPLLPAHLYDLTHADHARYDPAAHADKPADWVPSEEQRAQYINTNPHNRAFVGLGPYRVERFEGDRIRATRFQEYFAPERGGYLDTIDWLFVREDKLAIEALKNGELDVFARLTTEDYFGETTRSESFTRSFVKRHAESGAYWFIAWNLRRPKLEDPRVRLALAMAFDFQAFRQSVYRGLATQLTGHGVPGMPGYDSTLEAHRYDPQAAQALLAEAGWIDRDGDGVLDKDGARFTLSLLSAAGNVMNQLVAVALQNDYARLGILVQPELIEAGVMRERSLSRDFDGFMSGWALASESDPEKQFHSRSAAAPRSPNFPGLADPEVDQLIERAQRELDPTRRAELWRALQRRLYALQPYLWGFTAPRKFAFARALCGVELVRTDPNYIVRQWYYAAGTPGTRATRELR